MARWESVGILMLFLFALPLVSAPPAPCALTGSSISATCDGGSTTQCDPGEIITMRGTLSGDCSRGDFYQIDASGNGCDLLYAGGDMSGISDPAVIVNNRKRTLTGRWVVPPIHPACSDHIVTATLGKLYDGGPPGTGNLLSQRVATGSFRFAYVAPTCTDAWRNQDETDVDCGGTICGPCNVGQICVNNGDCGSGYCAGGICTEPTCTDGVKNQDETDVDCGGTICGQCGDGDLCIVHEDCNTGWCEGGVCAIQGSCYELYPGHNDLGADRINMVYMGVDYPNREALIDAAKHNIDLPREFTEGKAFSELEVYKDNLDKFNFWYIPGMGQHAGNIDDCTIGTCWCSSNCQWAALETRYCTGLTDRYVNRLCNWECRSSGSFNGFTHVSAAQTRPYTYDHEQQHALVRLRDEYTSGDSDEPGTPNCAADQLEAAQWWSDLVGQEKEGLVVGFYDGCSFVISNVRPTTTSVMRQWNEYRLGLVNERHISQFLSNFSGNDTNISGGGGAPPQQNALEITLDSNLNVLSRIPVIGGYHKQLLPEPYRLELSLPGKSVHAGFDPVEVEISEYDADGIHGEVRRTPKERITVVLPLGSLRASADGTGLILPGGMRVPYSLTLWQDHRKIREFPS